MSKIIFGNFINQFMTDRVNVTRLTWLSSRKIWYAYDGDMVIIPCPITEYFKQYAYSITGTTAQHVEVLCPGGSLDVYLASRIRDDANAYEAFLGFTRNRLNAMRICRIKSRRISV